MDRDLLRDFQPRYLHLRPGDTQPTLVPLFSLLFSREWVLFGLVLTFKWQRADFLSCSFAGLSSASSRSLPSAGMLSAHQRPLQPFPAPLSLAILLLGQGQGQHCHTHDLGSLLCLLERFLQVHPTPAFLQRPHHSGSSLPSWDSFLLSLPTISPNLAKEILMTNSKSIMFCGIKWLPISIILNPQVGSL